MSMERNERITCPECGQTQDFIIWDSLNGDLDPGAKQRLLDGALFRFECKNCGLIRNVNYGMLYHDMTHHAMVYYVDEASVEQTREIFDEVGKQIGVDMSGCRKRIVTDQNALREKAIIFENELDDRVVEIIKLVHFIDVAKRVPDANITEVYFMVVDGKYSLEMFGDKPLRAEVPTELYEQFKRDFAERLEAYGDHEPLINMYWASMFLMG